MKTSPETLKHLLNRILKQDNTKMIMTHLCDCFQMYAIKGIDYPCKDINCHECPFSGPNSLQSTMDVLNLTI
jgi:hypothetical protein